MPTLTDREKINANYPIALRVRGKYSPYAIFREMPYGRVCCKMYYPYNPQTASQQANRNFFAYAISNWQGFSQPARHYYNQLKYPGSMSGYNRYIRLYLLDNL